MNKARIRDVIAYTITENLKKKSIYITTIIIALVCVLVLPVIAFVSLNGNKINNKNEKKIEKVFIYDYSEFEDVGYDSLTSMNKDYKDMKISYKSIYDVDGDKKSNDAKKNKKTLTKTDIRKFSDEIRTCIEENKGVPSVIVHITHIEGDSINIDMTIPEEAKIKKSLAETLGTYINQLLTMKKYELSAKDEGELLELMAGVFHQL